MSGPRGGTKHVWRSESRRRSLPGITRRRRRRSGVSFTLKLTGSPLIDEGISLTGFNDIFRIDCSRDLLMISGGGVGLIFAVSGQLVLLPFSPACWSRRQREEREFFTRKRRMAPNVCCCSLNGRHHC